MKKNILLMCIFSLSVIFSTQFLASESNDTDTQYQINLEVNKIDHETSRLVSKNTLVVEDGKPAKVTIGSKDEEGHFSELSIDATMESSNEKLATPDL